MLGRDLLAKAKPGLRIINVGRGGIVDEEALAEAIRDGIVKAQASTSSRRSRPPSRRSSSSPRWS